MWNAPSDRDYYGYDDEPEEEHCIFCGADDIQPCEPDCLTNAPAEEPAELHEAETETLKEVA